MLAPCGEGLLAMTLLCRENHRRGRGRHLRNRQDLESRRRQGKDRREDTDRREDRLLHRRAGYRECGRPRDST